MTSTSNEDDHVALLDNDADVLNGDEGEAEADLEPEAADVDAVPLPRLAMPIPTAAARKSSVVVDGFAHGGPLAFIGGQWVAVPAVEHGVTSPSFEAAGVTSVATAPTTALALGPLSLHPSYGQRPLRPSPLKSPLRPPDWYTSLETRAKLQFVQDDDSYSGSVETTSTVSTQALVAVASPPVTLLNDVWAQAQEQREAHVSTWLPPQQLSSILPRVQSRMGVVEKATMSGLFLASYHLYSIHLRLRMSKFEWTVKRRYRDFLKLHSSLKLLQLRRKTGPLPSFPRYMILGGGDGHTPPNISVVGAPTMQDSQHELTAHLGDMNLSRRINKLHLHLQDSPMQEDDLDPIAELQGEPSSLISEAVIKQRDALGAYLGLLLSCDFSHEALLLVCAFLECSINSFVDNFSPKPLETFVTKYPGGRKYHRHNWHLFAVFVDLAQWLKPSNRKWFVVNTNCVAYFNDLDETYAHEVLLLDRNFTGKLLDGLSRTVQISNDYRELTMRVVSRRRTKRIMEAVTAIRQKSEYCKLHPHLSFAPVRHHQHAQFYVDADCYFESVADAMLRARRTLFISDWCFSPELYLKRPPADNEEFRLDRLLKRVADRGVQIYVLLYKEFEAALHLASGHAKTVLRSLGPNVQVLRHPDHLNVGGTLYWAHHEKIIVVDEEVAFIGGIDLCFGRWDTQRHPLRDLPNTSGEGADEHSRQMDNGAPMTLRDSKQASRMAMSTSEPSIESAGNELQPGKHSSQPWRLLRPFHHRHRREESTGSNDSSDNRPYNNSTELRYSRSRTLQGQYEQLPSVSESGAEMNQATSHTVPVDMAQSTRLTARGTLRKFVDHRPASRVTFPGKDYSNPFKRDFFRLHEWQVDSVDRSTVPRMPWHDVGVRICGQSASDVAYSFIQRWNFTKVEKAKNDLTVPFLIPRAYPQMPDGTPMPSNFAFPASGSCDVQILRSSSRWSSGCQTTERSIYNAYMEAILLAEHYIYIENQFFVSNCYSEITPETLSYENKIAFALFQRIVRARDEQRAIRIYVVIPLLPAFEGDVSDTLAASLRAVLAAQLRTIDALRTRLESTGIDPDEYIAFFSLRQWAFFGRDEIKTELIYVHDKIMIIDDRVAIVGSANINDRSMVGSRDSEIAAHVVDHDLVPSTMAGRAWSAGRSILALRNLLWREHLGDLREDAFADPASDHCFRKVWRRFADRNSRIYRDVFHCIPDDDVLTWDDYREFRRAPVMPADAALAHLSRLQGHLVVFPHRFLFRASIDPTSFAPEQIFL